MKNTVERRLEEITPRTLVVGIDIAKTVHWARFTDYRGVEIGKPMSFTNDLQGFTSIVTRIDELCKTIIVIPQNPFDNVIIGMEPTGHYWKALANHLGMTGYRVVGVNPSHTKKSKELDDNSQTKNDKKDAITIARLVKDGRYFETHLLQDVYGELRVLTNERTSNIRRQTAIKNIITSILDEYFPEIRKVFKKIFKGKSSRQILRICPIPSQVLKMGPEDILAEIRKVVKRTVGIAKVNQLIEAAETSIGVKYGQESASMRIRRLMRELDVLDDNLCAIEQAMEDMLNRTGYAALLLGIRGIGVVTAASFLGEVGDPLRFKNPRQIARYAGYNLVENSSGKSKSGTSISKRGRSGLRSLLYQMAFVMIGKNQEMKELYRHLITRKTNPLKKKQAMVVVAKKIITVIHSICKKQMSYRPELVFGTVRIKLMTAA